MSNKYLKLLSKCLDIGEIVEEVNIHTSKDNMDFKECKEIFHQKIEEIEEIVNKFQESKTNFSLIEIIKKYNLNNFERTVLYFAFSERFLNKPPFSLIPLLKLFTKGDNEKLVELKIKYLQPDSKLLKNNILSLHDSYHEERFTISKKVYEKICNKEEPDENELISKHIPVPEEIYSVLSKKVIGQEEAKRVLSIAVSQHYHRILTKTKIKNNILLIGPTGVGKTYLVRTLAEYLKVPVVFCSANEFTETGYVGKSVGDIIGELYEKAEGKIEKAEKGIVFIDEIDKIATCDSDINRDVSGRSVQEELLDLLGETEGKKSFKYGGFLHDRVCLDPSKILFIAAGAFEGMEKIKKKQKENIGFSIGSAENTNSSLNFETEDLENYGLIPELIGRFPIIVTLSNLTNKDLIRIMLEPENAVLNQYKDYFRNYGVELEITQPALEKIVLLAQKRKTGARALRSILEATLRPFLFQLGNINTSKIIIDEKCVIGSGIYMEEIPLNKNLEMKNIKELTG